LFSHLEEIGNRYSNSNSLFSVEVYKSRSRHETSGTDWVENSAERERQSRLIVTYLEHTFEDLQQKLKAAAHVIAAVGDELARIRKIVERCGSNLERIQRQSKRCSVSP
jgi:hypothetical protein